MKIEIDVEQFIVNYENSILMKKYTVNIIVKVGCKETKDFLYQQYNGYCQICGFTFVKKKMELIISNILTGLVKKFQNII